MILISCLSHTNAINKFDHDYISYMHIEKTSTFLFHLLIKWNCEYLPQSYNASTINNIVDFENMKYNEKRNNYTYISEKDYDREKGLTYINFLGKSNWTCTYPFLPRLHFGFHYPYRPYNEHEISWMMNVSTSIILSYTHSLTSSYS